jgi:hypothetical protein
VGRDSHLRQTALVVVALTGACNGSDGTITETYNMVALVYGRVQTTQGQPDPDASITLKHFFPACDSRSVETFTATTDSLGRYRSFLVPAIDNAGCVRVQAAADGFLADSTDLPHVAFGLLVVDSAEANLVLRRP